MIPILGSSTPFPPLKQALKEPNGLLAAGGDLSPERLISAYRQGIFPWFNSDELILWWSPDPRMVLFPQELKISRSLHKTLKKHHYQIRADSSFTGVMQACAAPREHQGGTWIHAEVIAAYTVLHQMGIAHSVETWIDGELAGGLYGVAIGKTFFGESMFSRVTDASKIALVYLAKQLENWGYGLIDCQMKTAHLMSMGAREIPRPQFAEQLNELTRLPGQNKKWLFDFTYPG
ncbi:leucyl/phenylalanyl-tRNA--protein transferase [Nitrosomonas sp.]|uniref:leucyl/phenylalanyl-tRNA--protein transferase n=1 Tax=Nitrosomonas sp. TaxID=42353 RepID=UPI0025FA2BFF|nr:leucyl/phenylalanyl-tRNA--protein transferase [Nitrosomonas sp.]MCC6917069.1 leucyl/phenylalanyl-tRNA--protein transferase [Nitrosomonas sp.]